MTIYVSTPSGSFLTYSQGNDWPLSTKAVICLLQRAEQQSHITNNQSGYRDLSEEIYRKNCYMCVWMEIYCKHSTQLNINPVNSFSITLLIDGWRHFKYPLFQRENVYSTCIVIPQKIHVTASCMWKWINDVFI